MSDEPIYVLRAAPPQQAAPLPEFPNPSRRRDGAEPALVLEFFSDVPSGIDVALGKMPKRDTEGYLRAIRAADNRTIIAEIDDAGGDAASALTIATALLQHPWRVTAKVVGRCSSAAVYVALAADERKILAGGSVLIHRAARICTHEQFEALRLLSADDRKAMNESLNNSDDAIASLLTARLGVSEVVARGWMSEERKWTSAEALANGFVSEVTS